MAETEAVFIRLEVGHSVFNHMEDFLFDLGVSGVLSALRAAVHNPERARKIRNVCLKIATKIFEAYPNDEGFRSVSGKYLNDGVI